ncbi:hypothetical protein BDW22DRAFT_1346327 [Trametopsis cervina]|nr:hypothetical protein BDW22DRAFT_1346327 [Trametopsis cervina]
MAPFASPLEPVPYPALYLYPLNDSFIPKHISLINGQRVKIGRQTNAKTVPLERNGYFDSKVLSRQHAEVWEDSGKIFMKDVKSSNGTFINGERLSAEGLESEPFELKTDDIVEFGIDIVGEDNKTIIHHKVAARVVCVFTEQEAQAAARAEAQQNPPTYGALNGQGPTVGGAQNAFSFAGAGGPGGSNGMPGQPQRRATMQPQGLMGMGGMGGGARQPGKSGLTFDHILSRLQGELQKSRETGAELHSLTGAMTEIHETLGGNLPPSHPPYPQALPPVVPPQPAQPADQSSGPSTSPPPASRSSDSSSGLAELQAQLHETQVSLANHVDKIRTLEGMLAEHEAIKREVSAMRDMMEERKREMELLRIRTESPNQLRRHRSHVDDEYSSDDDDTRSISTIVPHELERVEEEDEEQIAAEEEEERRRRTNEVRPRTPEPTMGLSEDDDDHELSRQTASDKESSAHIRVQSPPPAAPAVTDELAQRLISLADQLGSALELSRSLEAQHSTAQSTISVLESKVAALESLVHTTQSQVQAQAETHQQLIQAAETARTAPQTSSATHHETTQEKERESLTQMINEWKKSVEGKWDGVQEEWKDERDRLRRAREEWEARVRSVEHKVDNSSSKVDSGLASLATFQALHRPQANGHAKLASSGGLVTPPSPRSLSAESTRPRTKKRRTSSTRGRTRSRSMSPPPVEDDASSSSDGLRRRASWETESNASEAAKVADGEGGTKGTVVQYPITPEPSLLEQPISGSSPSSVAASLTETRTRDPAKVIQQHPNSLNNVSTALGVVVVVVAAAAVMWRMKPDGS